MTDKEILKAFEMRLDGYNLAEIGDYFGCTGENIRQTLVRVVSTRKELIPCKCAYPYIGKWMKEHKMSARQFNQCVDINRAVNNFYEKLSGKRKFTVADIKKIIAYTGLTFEEVIATQSGDNE